MPTPIFREPPFKKCKVLLGSYEGCQILPCSLSPIQGYQCQLAYLELFKKLKNSSEGVIHFKDRSWVYPLKNIENLYFEDSKESPLVRASDLIVSSAVYYIKLVMSGENPPELLQKIAFRTLGSFIMDLIAYMHPHLGPPLKLGSIIASTGWSMKLFESIRHASKSSK